MYRDGRLSLFRNRGSSYHAAVVSGVSRAGPLHDQGADDHEDLLASRNLRRPVFTGKKKAKRSISIPLIMVERREIDAERNESRASKYFLFYLFS